jgi:hypothetical protein
MDVITKFFKRCQPVIDYHKLLNVYYRL